MISVVVAMDEARGIGRDNGLMWSLPNDLKHFKALTVGKTVVMGRKTYESIGRPLPNRTNVVISRSCDAPGCIVVHSIEEALASGDDVVVIGGASIFEQIMHRVDMIHLTEVHARFKADTWFPALDDGHWHRSDDETHPIDERHAHPYTFVTLRRVALPSTYPGSS